MNEWIARRSGDDLRDREGNGAAANRGFNSTSIDSQYQRDRARIIHCSSFRSLQSKTQVLGLGESDFYRTRLTHSLEVAQIGSGICEWLRNNKQTPPSDELATWIPSFSLIEAICLAHDIGHSPFGHGGEVALNYMMKDHGGFEANGQTLRILAQLGEFSVSRGLDLTRRTQLGTIKYPVFYEEVVNYQSDGLSDDPPAAATERQGKQWNIDQWAPPKCLYESNRTTMEWMLEPFTETDKKTFRQIKTNDSKHHRSEYKSFDTSIMELADDIAYGVHDLEDALALGLVERRMWEEIVVSRLASMPENPITKEIDFYNKELFSRSNSRRKHAISKLVGYFIRNISVEEASLFEHPLLRYQATMEAEAYKILLALKQFVMTEVILRPELQTLQFKGQQVIINLFEIFLDNPRRLLPEDVFEDYTAALGNDGEYRRVIADYIAAMTDVSAGKLYHKLLTPTAGSIFDRT